MIKFACPILACRRYLKGFPRKRNLNLHIKTCHQVSIDQSVSRQDEKETESSESVEKEDRLKIGGDIESFTCGDSNTELTRLRSKLPELEKEKKELELCQARVERDILALKRAIQIVSD